MNQVSAEQLNKELEAQGALDNDFYSETLNNSAFKPLLKRLSDGMKDQNPDQIFDKSSVAAGIDDFRHHSQFGSHF